MSLRLPSSFSVSSVSSACEHGYESVLTLIRVLVTVVALEISRNAQLARPLSTVDHASLTVRKRVFAGHAVSEARVIVVQPRRPRLEQATSMGKGEGTGCSKHGRRWDEDEEKHNGTRSAAS